MFAHPHKPIQPCNQIHMHRYLHTLIYSLLKTHRLYGGKTRIRASIYPSVRMFTDASLTFPDRTHTSIGPPIYPNIHGHQVVCKPSGKPDHFRPIRVHDLPYSQACASCRRGAIYIYIYIYMYMYIM